MVLRRPAIMADRQELSEPLPQGDPQGFHHQVELGRRGTVLEGLERCDVVLPMTSLRWPCGASSVGNRPNMTRMWASFAAPAAMRSSIRITSANAFARASGAALGAGGPGRAEDCAVRRPRVL